ncbi:aldo/keto reductase family oxidoreductase [Sphingorhabdus arenilitoris]|uniref:Aldo/keto reductase family oxidoreductase n=1 Tax=Sphingorhabdus arenilitoris TaxID=1490041 RepID=A0ABV8RD28_9SPHN
MSILPQPPRSRKLGGTDIEISSLAWGMWRFTDVTDGHADLVHAAIDSGITLLDTADIYGYSGPDGFGDAESLLGQVFAAEPGLRGKIVLASKGGITPPTPYDSSAAYLTGAIDASLRRLNTDHLDLWQIHRPDILTHPQEIAATLEKAIAAGKVRAIGVSNFTPAQIDALQSYLSVPIVSTQPEFSPLCIDTINDGQLDHAIQHRRTVFAWSPLGGGRIAKPESARDKAVAAALDKVAQEQGVARASAAYSWIMAHPAGAIPIVGTQNPARIAEAAEVYNIKWSRQDWYAVLVAARGEDLP